MILLCLNKRGFFERTAVKSIQTAGMKRASCRRINGIGHIAFHAKRFGFAMGIRQGNRLQQRFGVWVAG